MKLLPTHSRTERIRTTRRSARDTTRAASARFVEHAKTNGSPGARSSDDSLGRGMELALTVLVFLGLGYLLDRWLGLFPLFTISLVVFAAVGSFIQMKYTYDAHMEALEAERAGRLRHQHTSDAARVAPATDTHKIDTHKIDTRKMGTERL